MIETDLATYNFDSIKQAAEWTGYPIGVLKKAKADGCDAFVSSRVNLHRLIRWVSKAQKDAADLPNGFSSWGDYLNRQRGLREAIKLEKDKGTVLDLTESKHHAAEAEAWYFNELDRMLREMPSALAGLSAMQVSECLNKFVKELRKSSREKFQAVAQPT